MKFILAFVLGVCCWGKVEAQNWSWANGGGGLGNQVAEFTTIDKFGNLYVTGAFTSHIITFGTYTLTNNYFSSGNNKIFLVKYDTNGNVLWAKCSVGAGNDDPTSVTTDSSGCVIISGTFESYPIQFDSITLPSACWLEVYVVKYDANGNVLWGKCSGGCGGAICTSIISDKSGNIYVGGWFNQGSISFDTSVLTVNTESNFFIVKYSSSGNVIWAKGVGGNRDDFLYAMTIDKNDNIYLTGSFDSDTLILGTDTLYNTTVWYINIFITRCDTNGNFIWARSANGPENSYSKSITTDVASNIYVAGWYNYQPLTFDTTVLTNSGLQDIFIAKYDSSGNLIWAKRAGGIGQDEALSVTTDKLGYVYIGGWFNNDTIVFGTSVLITGNNTGKFFLAQYNSIGGALCAIYGGGPGYQSSANSIITDSSCYVYVAGGYSCDSITFGSTTLQNIHHASLDFFFAKYKFNCDAMNLNEIKNQSSSIQIFPNPATTSITITDTKQETIQFFDMLGRNIASVKTSSSGKTEVDISTFPNFFFVKTQSGEVKKVVKE